MEHTLDKWVTTLRAKLIQLTVSICLLHLLVLIMDCMPLIVAYLESTYQPLVPRLESVRLNNVPLRMLRALSLHCFQDMQLKLIGKTLQLNSKLQVFTQTLSQEQ
jgi:hypothetical protein